MTKNNKTDELEFQCPLCGQELVAGLDLAGQEIFCPGCEQVINIPEPQPPDLPPPVPPTNQANQATVLATPLPPKPPEGAAVPPPIPSAAAAPAAPAPAEGGPKKLSLKIKK